MSVPSLVSLKDELDKGLAFADFGLSFLLSGEERMTERMKNEDKHSPSDSLKTPKREKHLWSGKDQELFCQLP